MGDRYLRFILKSLSLFIFIALTISCAQVVSPTGGDQDLNPPVVIKSIPQNPSTNFSGNKIVLNFNEYIVLKDINSQLIISPPFKKIPEAKVKYKTLSMDLEDSLKSNTTYTFSFGNSIVDFNEQNVLENYQFVFSTGNFLDSLTVSGRVESAFNKSAEKGVLVMLYALEKASKDSFPYRELPDYFAKSNDMGNFAIKNIHEGKYRIFALKDGNSNYLFDSDEEQIAFVDSVISIKAPVTIDLKLFKELKAKLYLKKPVKIYEGQLICAFSKPTDSISFEPIAPNHKVSWQAVEISRNKDTVRYWFDGFTGDSLKMKVVNNGVILDTAQAAIPQTKEVDGRGRKRSFIRSNINTDGTLDLNKSLSIVHSLPVKNINKQKITLFSRKDTVPFAIVRLDSLKRKFVIEAKLQEDSSYKLQLLPGAFEGFDGLKNDTTQLSFHLLSQRDYGTLKLIIKLPQTEASFILQLLDEKENVMNEKYLTQSDKIIYEYVKPLTYKLKLIADVNHNQKWDTGKFLEKQHPEQTYYFPQPLIIRANWDLEESWDLTK